MKIQVWPPQVSVHWASVNWPEDKGQKRILPLTGNGLCGKGAMRGKCQIPSSHLSQKLIAGSNILKLKKKKSRKYFNFTVKRVFPSVTKKLSLQVWISQTVNRVDIPRTCLLYEDCPVSKFCLSVPSCNYRLPNQTTGKDMSGKTRPASSGHILERHWP